MKVQPSALKSTHPPYQKKAQITAIVINALQIIAALSLVLYILFDGKKDTLTGHMGILVLSVFVLCVVIGAIVDIKESIHQQRVQFKMGGLTETVDQMSHFNDTLRAQRHDFLNHIQIVYSLMEMKEYKEAENYLEKVYGDMRSVSPFIKTKCPPLNALLRAKIYEGDAHHVAIKTYISSPFEGLPLPAWEMCRVISNLIDNAFDALKNTKNPFVHIYLEENLKFFSFKIVNNGPKINEEDIDRIFESGVSTKGENRGMGLMIARETMENVQGTLSVTSTDAQTAFYGTLPKSLPQTDE